MPLIPKPNYNQIFASQAPEQDKPAVFNSYPEGWGTESRPNNGKPTIKGFNYLQQTSDLKDLWILQNGACLPYDESIEYAEGAPVLKDGVIQYKTASGFSPAISDKPYILSYFTEGTSYPLNARVTLDNGDIVKSTVDGNTVDPNVDMTGWANPELDQNKIINKTGTIETLAESVDATPFLQALISAMPDGMTLDLLGKTFRVKKNTGFSSDYPLGDQPCLIVKDKKNVRITNGKLVVKEHGQGCFDVLRGSANFEGLVIQGAGNFPPLDGNTGRGEKSIAGTGWFDATMYNSGDPRNNSVDTSGYSTGGFGGNFPQWGGGTAPTWGMWNGGYIRNYGDGIYCFSANVVVKHCDISGFNGNSVTNAGEGTLLVSNSELHDNYTGGISTLSNKQSAGTKQKLTSVEFSNIYNMGHPDASVAHADKDPGYGVSASNSNATSGLQRYIVRANHFDNCKRKAIDAHNVAFAHVSANKIYNCGNGMDLYPHNQANNFEAIIVDGNYLENLNYVNSDVTIGIAVRQPRADFVGSANVTNNTIKNIGMLASDLPPTATTLLNSIGIDVRASLSAIVANNTLVNDVGRLCKYGVTQSTSGALRPKYSTIVNNTIRGMFENGIWQSTDSGKAVNTGNIVDLLAMPSGITGTRYGIYSVGKVSDAVVVMPEPSATVLPILKTCVVGGKISFTYDFVTQTASNFKATGLPFDVIQSDISMVTSANGLTIIMPTWMPNIKDSYLNIARVPRTATLSPNFYFTDPSLATLNTRAIVVISAKDGSNTNVNLTELLAGSALITLDF